MWDHLSAPRRAFSPSRKRTYTWPGSGQKVARPARSVLAELGRQVSMGPCHESDATTTSPTIMLKWKWQDAETSGPSRKRGGLMELNWARIYVVRRAKDRSVNGSGASRESQSGLSRASWGREKKEVNSRYLPVRKDLDAVREMRSETSDSQLVCRGLVNPTLLVGTRYMPGCWKTSRGIDWKLRLCCWNLRRPIISHPG